MLAGDDHSVDAHRLAVVILNGDLALAVRAQVVEGAVLADLGQALGQLVGQADGQGHQFGGLIAGIAEHHALVACTGNIIVGAQGDVGALAIDVGDDAAGVAVEAVLGAVIADGTDDVAGHAGDVDIAIGGDLAHDVDKAGGAGGLTGYAGTGVFLENGVQDGIRDLIADLVGMPLGYRLGREEKFGHLGKSLLIKFGRNATVRNKKGAQPKDRAPNAYLSVSRRIWHLAFACRLPGFIGPVPSAALDKLLFCCYVDSLP